MCIAAATAERRRPFYQCPFIFCGICRTGPAGIQRGVQEFMIIENIVRVEAYYYVQ